MLYIVRTPQIAAKAFRDLQGLDYPFRLRVQPGEGRNLDQNAKFHAICHDLSKSGLKWAGKERTTEEWKALLVSGHAVATGRGGEVVPGIEGEFVSIRESTAQMSKARSSSLIEYATAFAVSSGIEV